MMPDVIQCLLDNCHVAWLIWRLRSPAQMAIACGDSGILGGSARVVGPRAELLKEQEAYDVIIADLADPVAGGPCFQLYTKAFYADVVKRRLRGPRGVFVTQAGPAGILTAEDVFTPICNTLRQVFRYVKPYTAHIPSYADTWGWVMASDEPFDVLALDEAEIEQKLGACLLPSSKLEEGVAAEEAPSLQYFDGATLRSLFVLNKPLQRMLAHETKVYTEEAPLFVHGHGMAEPRPAFPSLVPSIASQQHQEATAPPSLPAALPNGSLGEHGRPNRALLE
eukprot:TRINITY_DN4084_c0_g1_i1.p1 TRINITY_DN4084_c0_g1~~TRINITY_DN4084_c0_g1_i1.p1  ORF type:complete len:280 (+),score=44.03 TRINITY_DN4084_c0_g1_i1:566-1405(+)